MAELPEVQTTIDGIRPYLVDKKILNCNISVKKLRGEIYKDICKNARLTCQRKKTMQTKQAMQTAYNGLKKMKYHKDKLDYANFVKAYADFGRGFIKNRFTFKTILHLTRKARDNANKPAVMINFKISGTSLPPYKKHFPDY